MAKALVLNAPALWYSNIILGHDTPTQHSANTVAHAQLARAQARYTKTKEETV